MSERETIARIIADTLDPETRGTIRQALASTRHPVDGPATAEEVEAGLAWADRLIRRAAERVTRGESGPANDG